MSCAKKEASLLYGPQDKDFPVSQDPNPKKMLRKAENWSQSK